MKPSDVLTLQLLKVLGQDKGQGPGGEGAGKTLGRGSRQRAPSEGSVPSLRAAPSANSPPGEGARSAAVLGEGLELWLTLPWGQLSIPLQAATVCLNPLGGSGRGVTLEAATKSHRTEGPPNSLSAPHELCLKGTLGFRLWKRRGLPRFPPVSSRVPPPAPAQLGDEGCGTAPGCSQGGWTAARLDADPPPSPS